MYFSSEPRAQPYVLSHLLKGQEGKPAGLLKDRKFDGTSGRWRLNWIREAKASFL